MIAALTLGSSVGCTQPGTLASPEIRPSDRRPVAAPSAPAAERNPLPVRPASLVPTEVRVLLTGADEKGALEVTLGDGRKAILRPEGKGVSLDGGAPLSQVMLRGPVRVDGKLHGGKLFVLRHPRRGLRAIVEAPLEEYVAGVVGAELSLWSARPEELKAQAIAARTFAAATIQQRLAAGMRPRLTDSVLDQAYRGRYEPGASAGARAAAARLRSAVAATEGIVLMRGDRLEEARYHAACGGHTADFSEVFRKEAEERGARGPLGVPCTPCTARARAEAQQRTPDTNRPLGWVIEVSPAALAQVGRTFKLGGPPTRIAPGRIDRGGRWLDVHIVGPSPESARKIPFDDFRRAIGYGELKGGLIGGTLPAVGAPIPPGTALTVQGRGRGHGVGLCQEAVRDLAVKGVSAEQILGHYYPGARLVRPARGR